MKIILRTTIESRIDRIVVVDAQGGNNMRDRTFDERYRLTWQDALGLTFAMRYMHR
jgi:hypothetical protein